MGLLYMVKIAPQPLTWNPTSWVSKAGWEQINGGY